MYYSAVAVGKLFATQFSQSLFLLDIVILGLRAQLRYSQRRGELAFAQQKHRFQNLSKVRIQETISLSLLLRFLFLQEIVDMERYIERVKKSIADKEPPLKVAETRLKKRTQAGSGNFPP